MEKGWPCIVADLAALPERSLLLDTLYQQGMRSYLRIPLKAGGELLGALCLGSDKTASFSQAETNAARPIADALAIALKHTLARQHLLQQTARLEAQATERTAELERMKGQLEAANRAKSRFLANISHELRTPLNSLLILSEMLADNTSGNLNPEQSEVARVVHAAGSDLLCLINDILDISKIESGRAAVHNDTVPVEEILGYIDEIFRRAATGKGLQFNIEAAAELPPALHTDLNHLKPILRNLMANAIKFTDAGSVSLKIGPAVVGWSAGHSVFAHAEAVVAFEVADTGIGIAAEKLPFIFDAFEQTDAIVARRYGGAGIGLHIARANAELLGGELEVASTLGQGSTFTLYLPLT